MKKKFIVGAIVVGSLLVPIIVTIIVLVLRTPSDVGTMPPSTNEYRDNRTNRGGEKFDNDYSPRRGVYPADIKHWVDLTDDGSGDGDEASQIVESKEECAALFDEYNANRALNNNAGFPRALAFTVVSEEINDLDTLVCRLQDRLVVDLDDDGGRIKEDSKSQVGRRFCADYVGGGSDEDSYLNCPAFQLESESDAGIQVPLCAWDVQDETCVEFTPVHYSLAPDDEVLSEVQGVLASVRACSENNVDNPILCPEGTVATGYEGTEGDWTDKIRLRCAAYRTNGTLGSKVYHSEYLGNGTALKQFNRYCRREQQT